MIDSYAKEPTWIMRPYTHLVSSLLFPLHERLKGHDTQAMLKTLESTQWLSAAALRAEQGRQLARLMEAVSNRVPFYRALFRERGLKPAEFDRIESLVRLPIIDKPTIRANFARFRADGAGNLVVQRTSGSSGEPLQFFLGRRRISADIAAKWRATRWWDVDIGDRELVFWGSTIETGHQDRFRRWRDALLRSRLVPTHDLTPARLDHILKDMRAYRPRMMFGYPSAMAQLAYRARETGLNLTDLGIRVAFCTSEVLRPEWRDILSRTFGCGVADEYGARDAGFIARECPAGGLHITAEALIVEVVDEAGQPLPDGEEGEILVTNLTGPEFPFIRYRTGDRGALSGASCPCGRGLPLLERISGRANDGLVSASGGWVHGSAVNHVMRDLPGLKAYRLIQDAREQVRVLLDLDTPLPESTAHQLSAHLRGLLGAGLQVEIVRVDSIPPLPNGKFRHVICNVSREVGAAPAARQENA